MIASVDGSRWERPNGALVRWRGGPTGGRRVISVLRYWCPSCPTRSRNGPVTIG